MHGVFGVIIFWGIQVEAGRFAVTMNRVWILPNGWDLPGLG